MRKVLFTAAAVTVMAVVYVGLSYHIVTGSTVSGMRLEKKLSMSPSETFINLDVVGNMPMISARTQYPMYVAFVERSIAAERLKAEAVKIQMDRGCGNIYVGMSASEILPKCGQPDKLKSSGAEVDMQWNTGVHIKTEGDKVVYVKGK